jgi:hypothetical protein
MKRLLLRLARTTGWLVVWALVAVATLRGYEKALREPSRARATRAAAGLAKAEKQLLEFRLAIANQPALLREIEGAGRALARAEGMLPPATDLARMEAVLHEELKDNGLRLVRFEAGAPEAQELYRRTKVTLEVTGPLPALLAWPGVLVARVSPMAPVMDGYRFRPETTPVMDVQGVRVERDLHGKAHRLTLTAWTYSQTP